MKFTLLLLSLFLLVSCAEPITTYPPLEPGPEPVPTTPVPPVVVAPPEPLNPVVEIEPTAPETTTPTVEVTPEPAPAPQPIPVTDEFSSYISAFETRNLMAGGSLNPSQLKVVFDNSLADNILGTCTMGLYYVRINPRLWTVISKADREELIFHELGHCVLGRMHDSTKDSNNYPVSVMNPYHFGPGVYLRSSSAYRAYQAELFGANAMVFAGINYNEGTYASKTYVQASVYRLNSVYSNHDHLTDGMDEITCERK